MTPLTVLAMLLLAMIRPTDAAAEERPFRVGFTRSMLTHVNENDARAGIKGWGLALARECNVPVDADPPILADAEALIRAMQREEVDAVGTTCLEYAALRQVLPAGPVLLNAIAGNFTETYLILAHRDGPVRTLHDLRGRTLLLNASPRTCLALPWLSLLLHDQKLPPASRLLAGIGTEAKAANAVLPVFFHKADACLVTRTNFDTMRELNPQLGLQLRVLAESPPVTPTMLVFRAGFASPHNSIIMDTLNGLERNPAGRQILIIFQSDGLRSAPPETVTYSLELLARARELQP